MDYEDFTPDIQDFLDNRSDAAYDLEWEERERKKPLNEARADGEVTTDVPFYR